MKSLERRFKNIREKNKNWSSYLCFVNAIKEQRFSKQIIHRWFNKLVDKDDYAQNEKRAILADLINLPNAVRTTKISHKSPFIGKINRFTSITSK